MPHLLLQGIAFCLKHCKAIFQLCPACAESAGHDSWCCVSSVPRKCQWTGQTLGNKYIYCYYIYKKLTVKISYDFAYKMKLRGNLFWGSSSFYSVSSSWAMFGPSLLKGSSLFLTMAPTRIYSIHLRSITGNIIHHTYKYIYIIKKFIHGYQGEYGYLTAWGSWNISIKHGLQLSIFHSQLHWLTGRLSTTNSKVLHVGR